MTKLLKNCVAERGERNMIIKINGKNETIEKKLNLSDLVVSKNLSPEAIVVEHNLRIIPQEAWDAVTLEENDTVEIVSFVGGG